MRQLTAFLYIAAGLACDCVFAVMVGTMLGMTVPTYTASGLLRAPALGLGPAMLVLAGVVTLIRTNRRLALFIEASVVLLIGVACWSVPRIGWADSIWLYLYPEAASLLGAIVLLLVIRRAWAGALVGAILSAPFFVYAGLALIRVRAHGSYYGAEVVSIAVPLALLLLSLIASLRERVP